MPFMDVKLATLVLLVFSFTYIVSSNYVIENLPGFPGKLPFKLETGYIGVGETEDVQLFYYFVESDRSPEDDPLMLWLSGGPGCSGFSALVYEIGPLIFDYGNYSGSIPTLTLNPYSWTKVANVIFLDQPAGSGFSYAKTPETCNTSDTLAGTRSYEFLKKSSKHNCNGTYISVHSVNTLCQDDLKRVNRCLDDISMTSILEPSCNSKRNDKPCPHFPRHAEAHCRDVNYQYSCNWANNKVVQDALHVREGTLKEWEQCSKSLHYEFGRNQTGCYTHNVESTVDYHKNFTHKVCRALIYSGDQDMLVPHSGTEKWIDSLNLPVQSDWRPWFVEHQIAGYTTAYIHGNYALTYATVKGGGHTAPEYKPLQCLPMIERWLSHSPL